MGKKFYEIKNVSEARKAQFKDLQPSQENFKYQWAVSKMSDREWLTTVDGVLESMAVHSDGNTKPRDRMPVGKTVDTAYAGPVPITLLARQDLEGETTTKTFGMNASDVKIGDCILSGGRFGYVTSVKIASIGLKTRVGLTVAFEDGTKSTQTVDSDDQIMLKSSITQNSNQLDTIAVKADKVDNSTQKHDLVSKIKENQINQQSSILSMRGKL